MSTRQDLIHALGGRPFAIIETRGDNVSLIVNGKTVAITVDGVPVNDWIVLSGIREGVGKQAVMSTRDEALDETFE